MSDLNSKNPSDPRDENDGLEEELNDDASRFPAPPSVPLIPAPPDREFTRPNPPRRDENMNKGMQGAAIAMSFAFALVAPIGAGYLLGYLIDRQFNSSPYGVMVMVLLGIGSAGLQIYKLLQKLDEAEQREKRQK